MYFCDAKLYFQHHYSILQCHMIFRNHYNILICCSRNISDYYQCWKQFNASLLNKSIHFLTPNLLFVWVIRTVPRDPGISERSSALSLMALIFKESATNGCHTMLVCTDRKWFCVAGLIHLKMYILAQNTRGLAEILCRWQCRCYAVSSLFSSGENPCELKCIPRGENFYYQHKSAVVDGTPCHPGAKDVCVDGLCKVSATVYFSHLHLL